MALYQAAMKKYHGPDFRQKLKEAREAAKALRDRRKESMVVARQLFPSAAVGSTGSSKVAADTSVLLTRAGYLLPNRESFAEFQHSMEQVIDFGALLYADTFTEDFVAKIRLRIKILFEVYQEYGLARDSSGLGGAVVESFLKRFQGDTDTSLMSPQSRLEWETYEELFDFFEVPGDAVIDRLRR